jgi:parvulin-like peptidyl-prolyl isomerase
LPKKKIEKPQREMTKRQLSHWQKESRLQRFTMIGGIIIILAILIVVGTGLYMNKYRPFHEVVIKVGDTEYTMDYYINMLAFYGTAMGNPQYIQYMADSVVQIIEENKILQEQAALLDPPVTVSDDEIAKYIKDNKLTSDQTRKDAVHAELLAGKLKDYFDKNATSDTVPTSTEQRVVLAMFLESQSKLNEVQTALNNGGDFHQLATDNSMETTSKDKGGDFGPVPKGVLPSILGNTGDTVLEDKVFGSDVTANSLISVEDKNQSKDIGYWLLEVTETNSSTNQVHLKAMLLGSDEQAKDIKAQLDSGADFVTLAKANSLDSRISTNSGDFGFISKGTVGSDTVDDLLFPSDSSKALPLNKFTDPVRDTTQTTSGGYWLIKVTEIQSDSVISTDNRTILINNKVQTWENKVWTDNQSKVQTLLTDEQKAYAIQQALNR